MSFSVAMFVGSWGRLQMPYQRSYTFQLVQLPPTFMCRIPFKRRIASLSLFLETKFCLTIQFSTSWLSIVRIANTTRSSTSTRLTQKSNELFHTPLFLFITVVCGGTRTFQIVLVVRSSILYLWNMPTIYRDKRSTLSSTAVQQRTLYWRRLRPVETAWWHIQQAALMYESAYVWGGVHGCWPILE